MIWSLVLSAVGLIGFALAGRKVWWAWYINIANQVLWVAYAIVTAQYGFLIAAAFYTFVFSRNAWAWTRDRPRPPAHRSTVGGYPSSDRSVNDLAPPRRGRRGVHLCPACQLPALPADGMLPIVKLYPGHRALLLACGHAVTAAVLNDAWGTHLTEPLPQATHYGLAQPIIIEHYRTVDPERQNTDPAND